MRSLLSLLFACLMAFTLGCGGESSYRDREAPPEGTSDPSAAMEQMRKAAAKPPAPKGEAPAAEGAETNE